MQEIGLVGFCNHKVARLGPISFNVCSCRIKVEIVWNNIARFAHQIAKARSGVQTSPAIESGCCSFVRVDRGHMTSFFFLVFNV